MGLSTFIYALPLRKKLIALIFVVSGVASLLGFSVYAVRDLRALHESELANANLIVSTVASYSAADLAFHDSNAARETLSGLSNVPQVVNAFLFDKTGKLFASLRSQPPAPPLPASAATESNGYIHVVAPVRFEGRDYGQLYLLISRESLQAGIRDALQTLALLVIVVLGLALLLAYRLQHYVSQPILDLAAAAKHVSDAADYSTRLAPPTDDEIGALYQAFNVMLERTQLREQERDRAYASLRDSEAQVRLLLNSTSEGIFGTDAAGICTFANPACVKMLGYSDEAQLVGQRMHELMHHSHPDGRHYPVENCAIRVAALAGQSAHRDDEVHWRADGTGFPVEYWSQPMYKDGLRVGTVVMFVDISERKRAEAELHRLAYYDSLTGLPNRLLFNDRLHQALADAKRRDRYVALMLLDIDRFKVINDTLGHEAGDQLLREIGIRLRRGVREGDTIARLGGDEFALIFPYLTDAQDAAQMAQNILLRLAAPMDIAGREVFSSASIGITLYPVDTTEVDALVKFADSAMYHAKEQGRSNYQFYSREMTASAQERLRLETDLRHALERGEFFLHYQPQVEIATGRITGMEALLRWRNGEGEFITPAQFIPPAEETGLIVPIGEWVLENACRQLKVWHDAGYADLTMAVNVASRQFRDRLFGQTVRHAITASGIAPQRLELEITEGVLLENSEEILRTLEDFKAAEVMLAIDDFGTGYSSLSYLKRFPIDRVKIDQTFVRDLGVDSDDLAIVKAIIALARTLKLRVIAEGVETEEQLDLLRSEGCDEYQGYLFARPMEAEAFSRLLQASNT